MKQKLWKENTTEEDYHSELNDSFETMRNQKSLSPLNCPSRNVKGSTLSEKEKVIYIYFFFHLKGKISLIKVNI